MITIVFLGNIFLIFQRLIDVHFLTFSEIYGHNSSKNSEQISDHSHDNSRLMMNIGLQHNSIVDNKKSVERKKKIRTQKTYYQNRIFCIYTKIILTLFFCFSSKKQEKYQKCVPDENVSRHPQKFVKSISKYFRCSICYPIFPHANRCNNKPYQKYLFSRGKGASSKSQDVFQSLKNTFRTSFFCTGSVGHTWNIISSFVSIFSKK